MSIQLALTGGWRSIELSWTSYANVAYYVYYYNKVGAAKSHAKKTLTTSATIIDLEDNATYEVYIMAFGADFKALDVSNKPTITLLPDIEKPNVVTNVTATPGQGSLEINWNVATNPGTIYPSSSMTSNSGIAYYRVTVTDSDGRISTKDTQLLTCTLTELSYLTHSVIVTAVNYAGGSSNDSTALSATPLPKPDIYGPAKVTGVSATVDTTTYPAGGTLVVSWNPATDRAGVDQIQSGIASYELTYGPGERSLVNPLQNVTSPYHISNLLNGTEYGIRVRAVDINGNRGAFSDAIFATPGTTDTTAPPQVSFTATPGDKEIRIKWTQVVDTVVVGQYTSGIKRYGINVYTYSGTPTLLFTTHATATESSKTIPILNAAGTPFNGIFLVNMFAEDNAGNISTMGTPQIVLTATPGTGSDTLAPSPPTNLKISYGVNTVTLTANEADDPTYSTQIKSGVALYEWQYSTDGITYIDAGSSSTPLKTISNLVNTNNYLFKVRAKDNAGNYSFWSSTIERPIIRLTGRPLVTRPTISNMVSSIGWASGSGAVGYKVEIYAKKGSANYQLIDAINIAHKSNKWLYYEIDANLYDIYQFQVRSVNADGSLSNPGISSIAVNSPQRVNQETVSLFTVLPNYVSPQTGNIIPLYNTLRCTISGFDTIVGGGGDFSHFSVKYRNVKDIEYILAPNMYFPYQYDKYNESGTYNVKMVATTDITGLTGGQTYEVIIVPIYTAGYIGTTLSATVTAIDRDTTPPVPVTNINVTPQVDSANNTQLVVSWENTYDPLSQTERVSDLYIRRDYIAQWGQASDTCTYAVYCQSVSDTRPPIHVDYPATQAVFTNINPADSYSVYIITMDKASNKAGSMPVSISPIGPVVQLGPDITPPFDTFNLSTDVSGNTVTLKWDSVVDQDVAGAITSGINSYKIRYNSNINAQYNYTDITDITATTSPFSLLTYGHTYSFSIQAKDNANNETAWSAPVEVTPIASDTTPPLDVQGLSLLQGIDNVYLYWNTTTDQTVFGAVTSGFKDYELRYTTDGGSTYTIVSQITDTFHYIDSLSAGDTYAFSIRARDNADNYCAWSQAVNATMIGPDITPPATPTQINAFSGENYIYLYWLHVVDPVVSGQFCSGLRDYELRYTTDGVNYVYIAGITRTIQLLNTLTNGTTYTFSVRAWDNAGNVSGWSPTATGTPIASDTTPPPVITGLSATQTGNDIVLSWGQSIDPHIIGAMTAGTADYELMYSNDGWLSYQYISSTNNTTTYTIQGSTLSTSFIFKVRVKDYANNVSAWSADYVYIPVLGPDVTPTTIPMSLSAEQNGQDLILSWNSSEDQIVSGAVTSGIRGYDIKYSTDGRVTYTDRITYNTSSVSGTSIGPSSGSSSGPSLAGDALPTGTGSDSGQQIAVIISGNRTSITLPNTTLSTSFSYYVRSRDNAGNISNWSSEYIYTSSAGPICFLARAPVLTPTGFKPICLLKVGDRVRTADGRTVAIKRTLRKEYTPSTQVNPYIIPKGLYGAKLNLEVSPNHEVKTEKGMVKAKYLELEQMQMSSPFTYYNIELEDWATDNLIVGGVEAESLAPVERIRVSHHQFAIEIQQHYKGAALQRALTLCYREGASIMTPHLKNLNKLTQRKA